MLNNGNEYVQKYLGIDIYSVNIIQELILDLYETYTTRNIALFLASD